DRGDVLTLAGAHKNVERVIDWIGYPDRTTDKTDMSFMGLGIAVGALVGAITIHLRDVPLSLSTSGGALMAGLVCGWLRSIHRTFGRVPEAALWVFNNVGLNTFIAVVGIGAGPAFVNGLKTNGLGLFIAGVIVTTVPFIVGLLAGKYIFKFHPAINVGACAGARTTTAALGAIQDVAKSKVPALGYTVPYAVGNTLQQIDQLSPFEIKDRLIALAEESAKKSAAAMLNAGRGNPNWVATTPREAFFSLGHFAITECKRVMDVDGVGGMPPKHGCAARLK